MAPRATGRSRPSAKGEPPRAAGRQPWAAALHRGQEQARLVLETRRRRAARRRAAGIRFPAGTSAGLLVAAGDSWFDYPFHDVLGELEERFNYSIESVAHWGDRVEEMIYDTGQLDRLARRFERLARVERPPRAILLSCGGNDIAGEEFAVFLNHERSGLPPLSEGVVAGVIEERLRAAIVSLAGAVTELAQRSFAGAPRIPIVIHGYDYPVPDGRGCLGGLWLFPGPWLEPGFRRKGHLDLAARCRVMVKLIDRFNAVLAGVAGGPGLEHLRYVDVRGTLSHALAGHAYRNWWKDELHPTEKGFVAVARRFALALRQVDRPLPAGIPSS
jgi:lysophospholipase L1-like esterase